jgi:hypothetical protein
MDPKVKLTRRDTARRDTVVNKVGFQFGASVAETAKRTTQQAANVGRSMAAGTVGTVTGSMRKGILKEGHSTKQKGNHWGIEWMIGSQLGQFTFLFCTAFSMVIVASVAWDSFGHNSESDDAVIDEERRWRSALWFSWALFFDPGTQTGLSGYAQTEVLLCAGIISSCGFIFNLVCTLLLYISTVDLYIL